MTHSTRRAALAIMLVSLWTAIMLPVVGATPQSTKSKGPLKVIVLAGQSNMQGHAKVQTLAGMDDDPELAALRDKLMDPSGRPRVIEDVWISSIGSAEDERTGRLTAGFGAAAGGPKIGPEFSFGAVMAERLGEPILIIKTAWGGKSLHTDFRPPSAGAYEFSEAQLKRLTDAGKDVDAARAEREAATGRYYRLMVEHTQRVLEDIGRVYPAYDAEQGYELSGLVWFQGWNDMVDQGAYPERSEPGGYDAYSEVMAHFIRDVRRDLAAPDLPFVIGVLGVGGPTKLYGPEQQRYLSIHQNFRDAMAAPASLPEFEGTVAAVLTEDHWDHRASELRSKKRGGDLAEDEARYLENNVSNAEYHYLGSAKILTGIGAAFADALLELQGGAEPTPAWIWLEETETHREVIFTRSFELAEPPSKAVLTGTCDDHMIVLINGERVGEHGPWQQVATCDVAEHLKPGANQIEVRARNEEGVAGLALRLALEGGDTIVTDGSWQAALAQRSVRGWFSKATVLGRVGDPALPWSEEVTAANFETPTVELSTEDPGGPQRAQPATDLHVPDGFVAELLYMVPNEIYGTWVALTRDDRGRLYTSDQYGRGLLRITPAPIGDMDAATAVERIDVDVSGAQGMCWAFDSLYVNVYGQGVWRITDTDNDDRLDRAEHLIELGNGGEHGPHAIIATEDGTGLYFLGGNHVQPPKFDHSMAPDNWSEDLLLPRLWDVGGHARGMMAPGGWIARCDPDGKNVTIVSNGYRNQYDIALNPAGEMFTYDSDLEWDIGLPWYRPTRLCHVTSGSEFGWRSGTGKWPAYYEDSTPPMHEVGPGSPTGLVFGTGAKFPARYQEALFALDWTFGTIYAVHVVPDGASYRATREDFVWAKPLGVTDVIVGSDGALYFTVGGRGSQSALYRVRYAGPESTAPVAMAASDAGTEARALRHSLEAFHGRVDPDALGAAWPSLSSQDRFVRFAARIAVENQPVKTWRERALAEEDPQAAIMALMGLARQGSETDLAPIVAALGRLPFGQLDENQKLAALRTYALAFIRLSHQDDRDETLRLQTLAQLEPLFPASTDRLNTELARLLAYLQSDKVVSKTLALMRDPAPTELPPWAALIQRNDTYGGPIAAMLEDVPPIQNIGYARMLMNATEGWTMPLREEYFRFFVEASKHSGGASYAGFLEKIRDEAAKGLTPPEERSLSSVLGQSLVAPIPEDVTPPVGPGQEWTLAAAIAAVELAPELPSFKSGENLYHAVSCSKCHRIGGRGGAIGPDLSTVANKFSVADILESIIDPSKVISEQYGSHVVLDKDGVVSEGILVENGDDVTLYSRDVTEEPILYDRSEIEAIKESPTSQMPTGLIDPLNPGELRDLVAYLVSGGNRNDPVFKAPNSKD